MAKPATSDLEKMADALLGIEPKQRKGETPTSSIKQHGYMCGLASQWGLTVPTRDETWDMTHEDVNAAIMALQGGTDYFGIRRGAIHTGVRFE